MYCRKMRVEMQYDFSNLNQTHLDTLKEEGVLVLPDFISEQTINLIKKETSPWLETVGFNNRISSFIIGSNQWIEHVGMCSLTALKLALDDQFINFLEDYFETNVALGSFNLQRKVFPEKGLRLHSDRGEGLAVFIYLTDSSEKTGLTEFLGRSHAIEIKESYLIKKKVDDFKYYSCDQNEYAFKVAESLVRHWKIAEIITNSKKANFTCILQPNRYTANFKVNQPIREIWKQSVLSVYPKVKELAKSLDCFNDLTNVFKEDYYFDYCCHINAEGNKILSKNIINILFKT